MSVSSTCFFMVRALNAIMALFVDANFISSCESEAGSWRTCRFNFIDSTNSPPARCSRDERPARQNLREAGSKTTTSGNRTSRSYVGAASRFRGARTGTIDEWLGVEDGRVRVDEMNGSLALTGWEVLGSSVSFFFASLTTYK